MNVTFLTVGQFNVVRFLFTQVLVTVVVSHITRFFLDSWRSLTLERSGSLTIGRPLPLWKTRSFSTGLGTSGVLAAAAAVALFSFEAWIELSSGAGEASELINTRGFEYINGSCEFLDTTLVYAPQGQAFCKAKTRGEVDEFGVVKTLEEEGKLLRAYAARIVSPGCCKGEGEVTVRYYWMGEPEAVRVLCTAGCRYHTHVVSVTVPTEQQCEQVGSLGIDCSIIDDIPTGNRQFSLNVTLDSELRHDPDHPALRDMRYSIATGVYNMDIRNELKLTCLRTFWGKTEFEARCILTLPDKTHWLGWASQRPDDSSGTVILEVEAHHRLLPDVEEKDFPNFLLAREVAPSHNEREAALLANQMYQNLKAITRRVDLVPVDQTPTPFRLVPFVSLAPWIFYFALLGCYAVVWVMTWVTAKRAGVVTHRVDDASRAYARWASEKVGAGQCANGISATTYVVITEIGSACHLTVDTKPSGVPLDRRPLLFETRQVTRSDDS